MFKITILSGEGICDKEVEAVSLQLCEVMFVKSRKKGSF